MAKTLQCSGGLYPFCNSDIPSTLNGCVFSLCFLSQRRKLSGAPHLSVPRPNPNVHGLTGPLPFSAPSASTSGPAIAVAGAPSEPSLPTEPPPRRCSTAWALRVRHHPALPPSRRHSFLFRCDSTPAVFTFRGTAPLRLRLPNEPDFSNSVSPKRTSHRPK